MGSCRARQWFRAQRCEQLHTLRTEGGSSGGGSGGGSHAAQTLIMRATYVATLTRCLASSRGSAGSLLGRSVLKMRSSTSAGSSGAR